MELYSIIKLLLPSYYLFIKINRKYEIYIKGLKNQSFFLLNSPISFRRLLLLSIRYRQT